MRCPVPSPPLMPPARTSGGLLRRDLRGCCSAATCVGAARPPSAGGHPSHCRQGLPESIIPSSQLSRYPVYPVAALR
eukprot:15015810-Alexandrium_andersonii.AAC.1